MKAAVSVAFFQGTGAFLNKILTLQRLGSKSLAGIASAFFYQGS